MMGCENYKWNMYDIKFDNVLLITAYKIYLILFITPISKNINMNFKIKWKIICVKDGYCLHYLIL